jgi:hypothetical protein
MKLAVISHKQCWPSMESPSGFATDGGFALQMQTLSELFDSTRIVVPCDPTGTRDGEISINGHRVHVVPLHPLGGGDLVRKIRIPLWLAANARTLLREVAQADAVHVAIPGDIGTFGMLLAMARGKPLYVRHCGNWFEQKTVADHVWKWLMQSMAGGRNVMLATGGAGQPLAGRYTAPGWIFSTSLSDRELAACRTARTPPRAGSVRLIIACRQERGKGTDIAIESLSDILQTIPEATLDVVGDGGHLAHFKQLAKHHGVADRTRFHGNVNHGEVLRLLKDADLFCYPTNSEGFPKVVLEALACGLPVITTRVSVLPELLRTGCGFLIDEPTPAALSAAVRACLSDGVEYERMSGRAQETAGQYSLERWRDTLGNILEAAWGPLQSRA